LKSSFIIVVVTTASKPEAEKIALVLLEEELIACSNIIGPVTSLFDWSGKHERVEEYVMFMKSRDDLFDQVSVRVKSLHSYKIPEVVAIPIVNGSAGYLGWLRGCLKQSVP
jgi:periplasmic divalent cation tolerance protein